MGVKVQALLLVSDVFQPGIVASCSDDVPA